MEKLLLTLGLMDLSEYLYEKIQKEPLGPIPIRHAENMYKKFLKSKLVDNMEIQKEYTFSVECQKIFADVLSISKDKTVAIHLFIAEKDFYGQLGNAEKQLQFAFQFDKKPEYYVFFNCNTPININEEDFKKLVTDFPKSTLYNNLSDYISKKTYGLYKENTKRISIEDIASNENGLVKELQQPGYNFKTLYVYPSIQTLNIFEAKDEILQTMSENLKQLFSFGIMISTHQIQADDLEISVASVEDRFRNCPPLVCQPI